MLGLVALEDVLEELVGEITDELKRRGVSGGAHGPPSLAAMYHGLAGRACIVTGGSPRFGYAVAERLVPNAPAS